MSFSRPWKAFHRGSARVALLACSAALALLAAGCGGGGPSPSVASLGATTTGSALTTPAPKGAVVSSGGSSQAPSGGGAEMTMAGGSRSVLAAYASCMRKNGEPNFPDPNAQGQLSVGSANGIDPSSPQFQRAQTACRKLLPNHGTPTPAEQAQARAQALAFSACMRKNGVPSFPDPQFGPGGRVSIRLSSGTGLDPQSPAFQAAQSACQKDLPGKFGPTAGPAPGSK
jgi:hypothetical protein